MNLADSLPSAAAWRRLAPMLMLMAAVLLLFRDTAEAMVAIWIRSETFAHAFLVPPIVVWLVWRKREQLAQIPPQPQPWILLPIALVCGLWLLGELASVNSATQFALVALLGLTVPAVFGLAMARALAFPLLFLFFAVPFGEFVVPTMMEWTAVFAAAAVQASGVPVYREGLQFVIPTGSWSVVEACSGIRYLIASFMVGTLFAYLNYRTAWRRAVFMIVSLLVPIVANWARAYLIVMMGHLSGNKLAAGVDHIIYGWVFFGLVIGIMFMIGARFSQPEAVSATSSPGEPTHAAGAAPTFPPSTNTASRVEHSWKGAWSVCSCALLLLLATQATFWRLDHPADLPAPALALPASLDGNWQSATALTDWVPAWKGASVTAAQAYDKGGLSVGVWVGYFRDQGYDRKLVSSGQGLTETVEGAIWAQTASGVGAVDTPEGRVDMRTASLRGSLDPSSTNAQRLRVWQVYWVGGRLTTSDARAKISIALNRLLGRGDHSAVLVFYTPLPSPSPVDSIQTADALLARFIGDHLPALLRLLDDVRRAPEARASDGSNSSFARGNP